MKKKSDSIGDDDVLYILTWHPSLQKSKMQPGVWQRVRGNARRTSCRWWPGSASEYKRDVITRVLECVYPGLPAQFRKARWSLLYDMGFRVERCTINWEHET